MLRLAAILGLLRASHRARPRGHRTAIAALVVAILPEEPFPPPLLAGYALTALGGLTTILLFILMGGRSK